ncbi:MAG: ParB family protein [Leifsonia sp.]
MERSTAAAAADTPDSENSAEFRVSSTSAVAEPARTPPKKRTTVTFYITDAMRNRARAAYRQTSFGERDTSWSEMLNTALLAEVERREAEYNDGRVFVGNDKPLTPGRPIGF